MNSTDINLKVRRVSFDLSDTPVHWFKQNPFATHLNNAFHCVFPDGEKFFIRSVQKFKSRIKDPHLKKQIDNFAGQEGTHFKEHQKFWKILESQGFDVDRFVNIYNKTAWEGIEPFFRNNLKENGDKLALAITVALEHFTAILAESTFEDPSRFNDLPEEMRELMFWHSAEEIEHKAIPFNVLKEIDDNYLLRVSAMLVATVGLFGYAGLGQIMFLIQDKNIDIKTLPKHFVNYLIGMRNGPGKGMMRSYFKFFKPDFHPDQIDNYHYAENYFATKNYN